MNGWMVLNNIINGFPPVAMALMLTAAVAACIVFIVGFTRRGMNFIKYGFGQTTMDASFEKRFDNIDAKFDNIDVKFDNIDAKFDKIDIKFDNIDAKFDKIGEKIGSLDAKIAMIETNHFGHLKNFLTELTSILVDKGVINNENKARLDNQLRGM
jgi:hypothetical protein